MNIILFHGYDHLFSSNFKCESEKSTITKCQWQVGCQASLPSHDGTMESGSSCAVSRLSKWEFINYWDPVIIIVHNASWISVLQPPWLLYHPKFSLVNPLSRKELTAFYQKSTGTCGKNKIYRSEKLIYRMHINSIQYIRSNIQRTDGVSILSGEIASGIREPRNKYATLKKKGNLPEKY